MYCLELTSGIEPISNYICNRRVKSVIFSGRFIVLGVITCNWEER